MLSGAFTGQGWIVSVTELAQCVSDIVPLPVQKTDNSFPAHNHSIYNPTNTNTTKPKTTHCNCGVVVERRTSQTNKTFLTCATGNCKYFRWADHLQPYYSVLQKAEWRTLPWRLFRSDFAAASASDIVQGRLGDCWFLSAIAVVSEDRRRFARLFNQRTDLDSALIDVTLFVDGRLMRVPIDRQFPVFKDKPDPTPIFSAASSEQLWVSAAEKAYAKVNGSYSRISGGEIAEGLFDILGLPVETVHLSGDRNLDILWARLLSFKSSGFLMGCATSFARPENGIAPFHAYSVIDVTEVESHEKIGRQPTLREMFTKSDAVAQSADSKRPIARLVKLRNPWGRFEWKGKWSSRCPRWTAELQQRLGKTDKNDGVFFMELDDFVNNFNLVDVCKTHNDDWHILNIALRSSSQTVSLKVLQPTWMYITAIKPSKRRYPKTPLFDIGIVIKKGLQILAHTKTQSLERLTTLECLLEAGEYKVEFPSFMTGRQFVLQIYSANPVMVQVDKSAAPTSDLFCGNIIQSFPVTTSLHLELRIVYGVQVIVAIETPSSELPPLAVGLLFAETSRDLFVLTGSGKYESGTKGDSVNPKTSLVAAAIPKNPQSQLLVSFDIDIAPARTQSPSAKRARTF